VPEYVDAFESTWRRPHSLCLQRSNELDRSKMQLAIMLEQANQIVKAKQYIGEQMDELKLEAGRDKDAWMAQRDDLIVEIRDILEAAESEEAKQKKAAKVDGEPAPWGELDAEAEQAAQDRIIELEGAIATLQSVAPLADAELAVWEEAFVRLAESAGEHNTQVMVSNFLKDDEANYGIFLDVVNINEEIEGLSEALAELKVDIAKAVEQQREKREEELNALRQKLRDTEMSAGEASSREGTLVVQLQAAANKLVSLYKATNCATAVTEWDKAARATMRRNIRDADDSERKSPFDEDAHEYDGLTSEPSMVSMTAEAAETTRRAQAEDAWDLLGPDVSVDEEGKAEALPKTARGVVVPANRARRPSTPPRSLMEFAGLTGTLRGDGLRVLLAEKPAGNDPSLGLATDASVAAFNAAAAAEEEEKRRKEAAEAAKPPPKLPPGAPTRVDLPPRPAIQAVEGISAPPPITTRGPGSRDANSTPRDRITSSAGGDRPGTPVDSARTSMKRLPSWMAKKGGPGGGDPQAPATPLWEVMKAQQEGGGSPSPLLRGMSMHLLDTGAEAKVPTETVRAYMLVLERRVQQLCSEFDKLVVTMESQGQSRFGVKGPVVLHDEDRHAFHIEPPDMEEYTEDTDVVVLTSLQTNFETLKKNRRASLASMVDGVPTMPQGPVTAILAIQETGHPVIVARPGTTYVPESNAANIAETSQRLARGESRKKRDSTAETDSRPPTSTTRPTLQRAVSSSSSPVRGRPIASSHGSRPVSRSPVKGSDRNLASAQSSRLGLTQRTEASTNGPDIHLVERDLKSILSNSHGKGRVILPGVLPNTVAPNPRQAYQEWIAVHGGGGNTAVTRDPSPDTSDNEAGKEQGESVLSPSYMSGASKMAHGHPSSSTLGPSASVSSLGPELQDASRTSPSPESGPSTTLAERTTQPPLGESAKLTDVATDAKGSRKPRYPTTLYSGYRIHKVTNYTGAGSGKAYASYNAQSSAAARQRIQSANISAGVLTVPQPAEKDALLRDVKRQYGDSVEPGPLESIDNARSNGSLSAYIHQGKFNEEEYKERQRQKEIDMRRAARRRSFEQLEAAMHSVKKAAHKLSIAEQHKDAFKSVAGSDAEQTNAMADPASRPTPSILGALAYATTQRRESGARVQELGFAPDGGDAFVGMAVPISPMRLDKGSAEPGTRMPPRLRSDSPPKTPNFRPGDGRSSPARVTFNGGAGTMRPVSPL
jgi:regulator of replication initiation timing